MASDKIDINVSQLLQQLEELKQKKAQNVKKLKKKLGRAAVFRQSNSNVHHINVSNDPGKNPSLKPKNSEDRNILGELKCEDDSLHNIQTTENIIKLSPEVKNNCLATYDTPCQDLGLDDISKKLKSDSTLSDKETVSNKDTSLFKQELMTDLLISSTKTTDYKKSTQDISHCRKRSVTELLNEGTSVDHFGFKKKTKLSDFEYSNVSEEQNPNIEINSKFLASPISQKICSQYARHSNEEEKNFENDSECIFSSQIGTNNKSIFRQKAIPNIKNIEEDKMQLHKVNEDKLNSINLNVEGGKSVKTDEKNMQNSKFSEKTSISVENVALNTPIMENVIKQDENKFVSEENISNQVSAELLLKNDEDNLDLNITEVADTEVSLLANSHSNVNHEDQKLHVTCLHPNKSKIDSYSSSSVFEMPNPKSLADMNTADDCLINICSNIASFEEVSSEGNKPEINDSLVTDKRDPFECTFTDEEDESSHFVNSEELKALFKSDSEENEETCEENNISNSEFEVADTNLLELEENDQCTNVDGLDSSALQSEVLIIPETELFDFASYNETGADNVAHNISITTNNNSICDHKNNYIENKISDSTNFNVDQNVNKFDIIHSQDISLVQCDEKCAESGKQNLEAQNEENLCNELKDIEFDSDPINTEDFLKLVNYRTVQTQSTVKSDLHLNQEYVFDELPSLKFQCCLQSDINEMVSELKMASFNNSLYLFIQHLTWIQVWRQEKDEEWMKIFAHQVEDLQMQDLCLTQNENYLILILLLLSESNSHCLQFLVFERESRLIKLLEHTHWFENKCEGEDSVLLCGLDGLKFAAAQGQFDFQIYSHSFSCLDSNPRLHTVNLGTTSDKLHSLCRIDKLPNALLGMSDSNLYVWHLLEARLVTSVYLQTQDILEIESCIWGIVENGLVFLMTICKEIERPKICQLLAVNLATGFCEVALTYSLKPALEKKLVANRKSTVIYSEPLIGAISSNGAFIWSAEQEYCCASLTTANYTSIVIIPTLNDSFSIIVGCDGGCVNCYELKF